MIRIKPSVARKPVTPSVRAIVTRGCVTPDQATCVYRHFSSDGELLYVGASVSPVARNEEHRSGAAWFRKIARIELEWFTSYPEAIDAERRAIRTEKPRFNTMRYGTEDQSAQRQGRTIGGRPRIHASGAERQRAYRERRKGKT